MALVLRSKGEEAAKVAAKEEEEEEEEAGDAWETPRDASPTEARWQCGDYPLL
jgi:hypothetical protein